MIKRTKLWTNISAITLVSASTIGLSGCDTPSSKQTEKTQESTQRVVESPPETIAKSAYSEGEGGGEGEGEGASDLRTDDIAYLTQLSLMRGHLYVGHELYKAGHVDHAKTHMKHPESELYAEVEAAFGVRGTNGFASELSSLGDAVNDELGDEAVSNAYANLVSAISKNETAVKAESLEPAQKLKLASEILRAAGEEYAIAVVDGEMQNAHEYQDALGFTTIAIAIVNEIDSGSTEVNKIKASALDLLDSLKPHWPTIVPPETLTTASSAIYVAAAKIELLSLRLN